MRKIYPFFSSTHPFSNWYSSTFVVDDITFRNGEQWMMYCKAKLFEDEEILQKILSDTNPRSLKRYGRMVRNFDQDLWDEQKRDLVKRGLKEKFLQNTDLKEALLSTKYDILVEASPYDKIWGIGIGADHPNINNPAKWKGQNLLGAILMEIREELI